MIYLDSMSLKLQAVLASAANTSQPEAHVWFYDVPSAVKEGTEEYRGALKRTALSDTTDVDICLAPLKDATTRVITALTIYNKSLDTEIVTIKTDNGTTEFIICKVSLATGETLFMNDDGFGTI